MAEELTISGTPIYLDTAQPLEARVEDLLSRLTLEEKVSLLHGDSKFTTAAIPRLGIPRRWMSDGPHGVREDVGPDTWEPSGRTDDFASYLPVLVNLAATWDPELAREYGVVIGEEARQRGKEILLGPGVNIVRTPLNGRNFEYLGEDPYLTSRMAVPYIQGLQSQEVAACVKHFAVNNQEMERMTVNVEVDERALREIYLPAFKAAVQEGGALAVMGAYNKLRGQHCCHNDTLLNKILKSEWGYQGLVMSDWSGTHDTDEAARNGLDVEMGTDGKDYADYYLSGPYLQGLASGKYCSCTLDDKARRNLREILSTGVVTGRSPGGINTKEHQQAARRIAEAGIVLLKNTDSLLPLDADKVQSIAVIGDNAVAKHAYGGDSARIKAFYEITPLDGIIARAGRQANISFSHGYDRTGEQNGAELLERAVAAAKSADVAIVVGGLSHDHFFDCEAYDRSDMALPFGQDELIRRVHEVNPRTVVVLLSGAPVEMGGWVDSVPAILEAWYPGMEGGNALASILFGDVNSSGKLPVSFPKVLADSPAHALGAYPAESGTVEYKEGLLVGYRWFDTKQIEPQFAFGHGLSYTTFEYSNLHLAQSGDTVTVRFDIANSGARAGAEVAQVYVRDNQSSLPRPLQELKGFEKIHLQPGEKRTVAIALGQTAFAFYDPARSSWMVEAGEFTILVGGSSRDIRLEGRVALDETVRVE